VQICEEKNKPVPTFVVQECEKILRCAIFAHGFARTGQVHFSVAEYPSKAFMRRTPNIWAKWASAQRSIRVAPLGV
jgi:hypothetical protein